MKRIIYLLLTVITVNIYGQSEPVFVERVYMQTDKQLYLAGEIVYMKVLTVSYDKKPLSFSKIAYVELVNESISLVQIKIELSNGVGEGWMELPLNLPTAHYRLIAYTRFMRNENESVFFEKNIGIINTFLPNQISRNKSEETPMQTLDYTYDPTCAVQTDKTVYSIREKGNLKLDGLPNDVHTLSVSIAGKSDVAIDDTNEIWQWEKQTTTVSKTFSGNYIPEYEGHIITGKIVPAQSSTNTVDEILTPLLSFPGDKLYLFEGQRDESNNVFFYASNTAGVKEMATSALNHTDNIFRIDLQSPFIEQHASKKLPALRVDSSHFNNLLDRKVALQALYSFTKDTLLQNRTGDNRFNLKPTNTYLLDEFTRFIVMNELMVEFIFDLRFRKNVRQKWELYLSKKTGLTDIFWVRPLVVLDGIPIMEHSIIYNYDPLLVERVNIYAGEYAYGGMKYDGIAEFLTYKRNYPSLTIDQSIQIVNYAGAQAPRRFIIPDYSIEKNRISRLPDYRHTLLWEPMTPTNAQSSIEIPFYTSDFTGEFLVTVEGLTEEGKIIYASKSFEVR